MAAQRERARAAGNFQVDYSGQATIAAESEFTGYEHLRECSRIEGLLRDKESVDALNAGEEGAVILDRTPFYAESGGQVGDRGEIVAGQAVFAVRDTQKLPGGAYAHVGKLVKGTLRTGESIEARVDEAARRATTLNHSATHLLHAALRRTLGDHVAQKGSLVEPDRLRFDFSHFEALSREQIEEIEVLVNDQIRANAPVETAVMSYDEARSVGAMALFGEKYGDRVRVLTIGEFSKELCGGTHAGRAGDIGLMKIVSEGGVAAGVRRIEALTGAGALAWVKENEQQLDRVATMVKGGRGEVVARVEQILDRNRQLERELERLKGVLASSAGDDLASQAQEMNGCKVLAAQLDDADPKSLRDTVDQLKNKLGSAVVVLATVKDGKVSLVAGVTPGLTDKVKASDLANHVAGQIDGKGGGRPDMAQAGGNNPALLASALKSVPGWVQERLA
jgi:alanyl-tRNA synthetase